MRLRIAGWLFTLFKYVAGKEGLKFFLNESAEKFEPNDIY